MATLDSATHEGERLFTRAGWQALDCVPHDGRPLHFFSKSLDVPSPIDLCDPVQARAWAEQANQRGSAASGFAGCRLPACAQPA